MNNPRAVVFGYGEVGYVCLDLLLRRDANVVGVFTHQDNPGEQIWFRSVAKLAGEHGLPVFTPESFKEPPAEQALRELQPDIIFSFYYRRMIPERLLQLAPLGAFNMHGSLLPKYRGKAPVNWAVLHGETQTGATLHHMVKRADAGDIVDQEAVTIGPEETAFEVMQKVQEAAVRVLDRQLAALLAGTAPHHCQNESQATYFGGRTPEDGRIDWHKPARHIFNIIRAVTRPFPGAFTDVGDARLMIWWAKPLSATNTTKPGEIISLHSLVIGTGEGHLEVTDFTWVQRESPAVSTVAPSLAIGQVFVIQRFSDNKQTL